MGLERSVGPDYGEALRVTVDLILFCRRWGGIETY